MKFKMRKSTVVITALSMLTVGSSVYAADYHYDGLNRVTSVEKEGKKTAYIYDQAGNLLNVTTSAQNPDSSSFIQKSSILSGWTPYKTTGTNPSYELNTTKILREQSTNVGSPKTIEESSTGEKSGIEEGSAGDEHPTSDAMHTIDESLAEIQWITINADRTGGANVYRDIPVQGNMLYPYKGWAKSEELKDASVQVVVNYYDSQNRMITYENLLSEKQNTDWKLYEGSLKIPAGAVLARIHLQVMSLKEGSSAKVGFSDVVFGVPTLEGQQ